MRDATVEPAAPALISNGSSESDRIVSATAPRVASSRVVAAPLPCEASETRLESAAAVALSSEARVRVFGETTAAADVLFDPVVTLPATTEDPETSCRAKTVAR